MPTIDIYINLKISALMIFIFSMISLSSFAQIFDSEQSPLSVKWRSIDVDGFKIIYPSELEKDAQRMANTIPKIYPSIGRSLSLQKTSIPIVLQNRGTVANGFVQLAPKKSQFYTTPPQQFDSQDWLNNLAVHELRHVAQFDKITGVMGRPFPEEIYFAYMGAAIPTWFFEGDAVSTETSLTKAGRGRQPTWVMPFRTSVLNKKKFSYSKNYFGSAKDITAGYYQMGYLMVSKLRKDFGSGIADSLLSDISKRPLRLYPFSRSLKKYTGNNTNQFYKKTITELAIEWQKQEKLSPYENYASLNRRAKFASNYYLPTALSGGKILALKQTKGETAGFVIVNPDKSEKKLFKIAYQEQPWFSYSSGIIVWDEIRYDPRYKQRSYSVVCSYNLITKRKTQLTFRSRLFSPAISGDGKRIVAVRIDLSNKCNLVVLDAISGKIMQDLENPNQSLIQTPALSEDGSKITFIGVTENGKTLNLLADGLQLELIPPTRQQLSRPVFFNDKIAFNAHLSGVDNIYELDIQNKKISALTAAKFGAFNLGLSTDGKSFLFNNFDQTGYNISQLLTNPRPLTENHFAFFGAPAAQQEGTSDVFQNIPNENYSSKSYSPLKHSFNFHSLSPTIDDGDRIGLQLKSNDLLNTVDFFTGLSYHSDLRKIEYNAGITYKSFYPIFSALYRNLPRMGVYEFEKEITAANWRENVFSVNATLPLSINHYNSNYSFTAEIGTSFTQRNFAAREAKLFRENLNFPMTYRTGFSHSVRSAERDIAPKWAQSVSFSYLNQPFDKNLKGSLIALESAFYFPGLARNHSFVASFNYQETEGSFTLNNEINTVYGYGQIRPRSLLRNTVLLNYRFPIAFPDTEIGSLAYVRNLRGGFFSHYENIGKESNLAEPKTFGIELRSSLNLLRYQPVIDLGTRLVFVNQIYNQNPILEFTFNYSF